MTLRHLVIALTLATSVAQACPPGPCLKYRHLVRPPPPRAPGTAFTRTIAAEPPARLRDVASFLTSSTWQPAPTPPHMEPPLALHFVDPRRHLPPAQRDERQVLVRRIERDPATNAIMIEVDGVVFELARCPAPTRQRRWTSCLTERDDLSFDLPVDHRFAAPP